MQNRENAENDEIEKNEKIETEKSKNKKAKKTEKTEKTEKTKKTKKTKKKSTKPKEGKGPEEKNVKHCEALVYDEDGWDEQMLVDRIGEYATIKSYCIAHHNRGPEKPHYHVYLHFGNSATTIRVVAKWFGLREDQVQLIHCDDGDKNNRNGRYRTINYYTHRDCPDKVRYDPAEFVANFDVVGFLEAEKQKQIDRAVDNIATGNDKKQLNAIIDKCASGEITRYNYHQMIPATIYAKYRGKIENAWRFYDECYLKQHNGCGDRKVIYIYGASNTGKTTLANLWAEQNNLVVYKTSAGGHPYDEYADQPVIVLDEFRPNEPTGYAELLRLIDPHQIAVGAARYNNKVLKASTIIITTVFSPRELYDLYHVRSTTDSYTQLIRRMGEVWHVHKDTIDVMQYDPVADELVLVKTIDNPVSSYLETLTPAVTTNASDTLEMLNSKYQDQQLSLF